MCSANTAASESPGFWSMLRAMPTFMLRLLSPGSGSAARPSLCRAEPVELGGVVVEHEVALLRGQVRGLLGQHGLRVRPRRVAVRKVVRPHEPADVAEILHLEGYPVVLERRVDVLAEVLARHPGDPAAGE